MAELSSFDSIGAKPVGGGMWLLVPTGTDIRDFKTGGSGDTVEVGAGTGRFYVVCWVDDIGGGFANEHRFAELVAVAPWPVPYPTPAGGAPPFVPTVADLGIIWSVNATSPLSLSITALPGTVQVLVAMMGPGWSAPLLRSSVMGVLSATTAYGGPSIGSSISGLWYYQLNHPGGPDTLTLSWTGFPGPFAVIQSLQWSPTWSTPDTAASLNSSGSPTTIVAGSACAAAGDECVLFGFSGTADLGATLATSGSGLIRVGSGGLAANDANNFSWVWNFGTQYLSAGVVPSGTVTVSGNTFAPTNKLAIVGLTSP